MELTIGIVTMNREKQLKEFLKSCLLCILPKETEFVVIDNASIDDTEQTVQEVLGNSEYPYIYKKLKKNIGAGGEIFTFNWQMVVMYMVVMMMLL